MYKAINDKVIVTRSYQDKMTESGIIVANSSEGQILELTVVDTTDITKALQDKVVYAPRHKVAQINESEEVVYGSIDYKDIIAVKD
jgi:co-chaperonin GroES (HSP10)